MVIVVSPIVADPSTPKLKVSMLLNELAGTLTMPVPPK